MTWSRFWPATCSLWAVVTVAAVLAGVEGPARTVLVFAFMLACPGMAVVGLLTSFSYSATGIVSVCMTHSCLPIIEYKPQWINIPKRASWNQFKPCGEACNAI